MKNLFEKIKSYRKFVPIALAGIMAGCAPKYAQIPEAPKEYIKPKAKAEEKALQEFYSKLDSVDLPMSRAMQSFIDGLIEFQSESLDSMLAKQKKELEKNLGFYQGIEPLSPEEMEKIGE